MVIALRVHGLGERTIGPQVHRKQDHKMRAGTRGVCGDIGRRDTVLQGVGLPPAVEKCVQGHWASVVGCGWVMPI